MLTRHRELEGGLSGLLVVPRPVVAGQSSYNVGSSEIVSDILESAFKAKRTGKVSVISSEDLISRIDKVNKRLKEAKNVEELKMIVEEEDPILTAIGCDVKALFPNLCKKELGRLYKMLIAKSLLSYDNIDTNL